MQETGVRMMARNTLGTSRRFVRLTIATTAALACAIAVSVAPSADAVTTRAPAIDHVRHGRDALQTLTANGQLGAVALKNRWSVARLRAELGRDESLHVTESGRLLYVDDAAEFDRVGGRSASTKTATPTAAFPYANTFALHSLAGSTKVMYIDAVGFANATTGETFTALNLDGNLPCAVGSTTVSCFTNAELDLIQDIWTRTAEAYSAFDVDVTTQDPGTSALYRSGTSDTQYGARMIVGTGDGVLATQCSGSCAGLAWVGAFNASSANLDPVGVVNLPNFTLASARNISQTVVHELGHVVNLSHTATAEVQNTLWGPWMSALFYGDGTGPSLHQFTQSSPQDQYAQMTTVGLVPRSDEPSPVVEPSSTFSATGYISTPTDSDTFSFTVPPSAGASTISVVPPVHSSLDITASILDNSQSVIATSNPLATRIDDATTGGLDATFNTTLAPGAYTLVVQGTGQSGLYSNYGSIGSYTVTAVTPITPPTGISIAPASVVEGDSGKARTITFAVTLPAPSSTPVTVDYAVQAGVGATAAIACNSTPTCMPGLGADFRSRTGTLTFRPSALTGLTPTTVPVNVLVYPDTLAEGDETLSVVLTNPNGGPGLGLAQATGTIFDDDPLSATPQVAIGDAAIAEGNSAANATTTNKAKLWITLSEPAIGTVTVLVTIQPASATAGTDFVFGSVHTVFPVTKTITFAPGQYKKSLSFGVFPDALIEGDEVVTVTLSNASGATIGRSIGTFTIINDD